MEPPRQPKVNNFSCALQLPSGAPCHHQRMQKWLALLALCISLLSGCLVNFAETTLVRVRNPSAVAAFARTPGGTVPLLAAEGPPAAVKLPGSRPPFTDLMKETDADAVRQDSGVVTLTCPSCKGATQGMVVPFDAPIELHGSPGKTLTWTPGSLEMRFSHEAILRCYRRGECPREALALGLATPRANVVDIRYRKLVETAHGERTGALIMTVGGAIFLVGGLALAVGLSIDKGHLDGAPLLGGGWFSAGGTFGVTAGLMGLLAKDSETVVPAR